MWCKSTPWHCLRYEASSTYFQMYIEQKPQSKQAIREQLASQAIVVGRKSPDCRVPYRNPKKQGIRRSHILGNAALLLRVVSYGIRCDELSSQAGATPAHTIGHLLSNCSLTQTQCFLLFTKATSSSPSSR